MLSPYAFCKTGIVRWTSPLHK
uniref:Uncharacterized protein n=1 Tax=Medicago truncatula TaxID=3880 RepID=B7FFJ9_MEDTR|nr:unknown [Medicago truncatula]AFK47142.1 unknown [Medicago truncatula]